MRAEIATLPYSRKAVQILADILGIHHSMIWLNPTTNRISIKQVAFHQEERDVLKQNSQD